MSSPWVTFPTIPIILGGIGTISDILVLAVKSFQGKLVNDEGFLSTTGDLATITASGGNDMYLARAKVTFYKNISGGTIAIADKVELKVNGTVVETAPFSSESTASADGGPTVWSHSFENIGHKVTTGQIIKLEVITLDSETDVEGFVECFEEPTGTDPFADFQ